MQITRIRVIIPILTLVLLTFGQPMAKASVRYGANIGEYGLTFYAGSEEGNVYPFGSPTVSKFNEYEGAQSKVANEYVGSAYNISAWMVPVGDHLNVNCQSNIKMTLLKDGKAISQDFPISSEDGNDYRIDNYILKFDSVGLYAARFTGGLSCKWRTDGHSDFNSAEKTIYLAKVMKMVVPTKITISSLQCPKQFKITTEKNSRYTCTAIVQDKDHVSDSLTMNAAYCGQVNLRLDKTWARTPSGWKIPLIVNCPMVTPNQYNNLRRVENFTFSASVTDSEIRRGERFTEFASANYSFGLYPPPYTVTATFVK